MPDSKEIAELKTALQAMETRLEGEISLAEERQKLTFGSAKDQAEKFQTSAGETLKALADDVGKLKSKTDRPWFRTPAFWAGFLALPGLMLGGWIVKAVFDDPAMLRLIHKGFGTEIAVGEAIDRGSALNDTVEKALARKIAPNSSTLSGAITDRVGQSFVSADNFNAKMNTALKSEMANIEEALANKVAPNSASLGSAITEKVSASFVREEGFEGKLAKALLSEMPTMHLDIIEVGLVDEQKLLGYDGDDAYDLGRINEATTVFSAVPGQKVRIDVGLVTTGVNLRVIERMNFHLMHDLGDDSEATSGAANLIDRIFDDGYEPSDISQILEAELGGEPIIFTKQPIKHVRKIGGQELEFWSYSAEDVPIEKRQGAEEFPLQTLSFRSFTGDDFIARIAIIVSRID